MLDLKYGMLIEANVENDSIVCSQIDIDSPTLKIRVTLCDDPSLLMQPCIPYNSIYPRILLRLCSSSFSLLGLSRLSNFAQLFVQSLLPQAKLRR